MFRKVIALSLRLHCIDLHLVELKRGHCHRCRVERALKEGGEPPRVISIPRPALATIFKIVGRREGFERVAGSLVVRTDKIKRMDWMPTVTSREAIRRLMQEV